MTKKKKLIIGISSAAVIVVILALLLIFVFDVFGLFTSSYRLDYDKYIKLGNYKGLEYDKISVSVSDKEVKEEINNRLEAKTETKDETSGTVKDGDTITISYVGKIDGKTFAGGSAENSTITIGETQMIDGFIDGLIGKKVGDKVTLNLKFPKDYQNEDVAGKKVVFDVTIKSKQVKSTPKYNLDFVKENSNSKTLEEYEASVKKDLEKQKTESAEDGVKQTLWSQVVASSKVKKYPKKQLAYEEEQFIKKYKDMAKSYGATWKDFLKQYMQMSEKDFNKQTKEYAKTVVAQKLTMHAIAEKEDLEVSSKEYKNRLDELLKQAGFTKEQFQQQYNQSIEEYAKANDFGSSFLLEKVEQFILDNGKVKAAADKDSKKD
ncbi:trigger factor [Eubacterium sp. AB3007]|uniref:trigger factor n=1 Tax=Eubacterium sp. AB3007 TaxID=1392487 RepID=UPI000486E020|nr:trigger factor [Eubacterium sp. AB3007]